MSSDAVQAAAVYARECAILREERDDLRARIAELERELSHYRTLNIATAREMRRRIEERRVKT